MHYCLPVSQFVQKLNHYISVQLRRSVRAFTSVDGHWTGEAVQSVKYFVDFVVVVDVVGGVHVGC